MISSFAQNHLEVNFKISKCVGKFFCFVTEFLINGGKKKSGYDDISSPKYFET